MHSPVTMTIPATFQPEVRIAISLRLSRSDDASTSLDVQLRACKDSIRAAGFDPERAEVFIDDGVSGATPLSDRDGMSSLMAYRPTHVWAWKLDRYSRSVREFLNLVAWAETPDRRVILATADGSLNTATPGGRLIALILVALAEWERQMMTERILAAHQERREQGRWSSGFAPFPFKVVREHPKAPAYLDADSAMVPLVIKAVGELLAGGNIASSSRLLPIGRQQWRKLLLGVTLRGWRQFKGELIVQEDGVTPVQFAPEILDAVTHARLLARLDELSVGVRVVRQEASPLLIGFILCGRCEGRFTGSQSGRKKPLYQCANHGSIMAHLVEPKVESDFLNRFGAEPVMRAIHRGGVDHTAALLDLTATHTRIMEAITSLSGPSVAILATKLQETEATIERLRAEHDPEVRTTYEPTDMVLRDVWADATEDSKRSLLTDKGLRVTVHPNGHPGGRLRIQWGQPPIENRKHTRPITVAERRMAIAAE
ncbi:recombinase family protein [Kitasatospora purpeofusca]|uniref:recombinase family protein n=1 Tax=Kitasatospora purpeofusca TaxID=67352 RepID=UPI002E12EEA3|nr:recombinase family protein [Kitasatospora purpeofusca]